MALGFGRQGRREKRPAEVQGLPITRRGLLVLGVQLGVAGGLVWRMRQLEIVEHDHYRMLAEDNRINVRLIAPERGQIFDRNGKPLAINIGNYRVVLVREQAGDAGAMLSRLGELIDISDYQRERVLREIMQKPPFVPVGVAEHLSWEDFAKINVNAPALPGIEPEAGLSRQYPHGVETAHIVGYVGRVTERDLQEMEQIDPVLQIPEFQIGKTGVEKGLDEELRGKAGTSQIEVNAVGRVIREIDRQEGVAGDNLHLTTDLRLQQFCHDRLADQSAAAVVMDVRTGDLLAAASTPSFDPNPFVLGISQNAYDALLENDHRPLHNKWAAGMYPPGSTFKVCVALAALEAGAMSPSDKVYCPGYLQLGRRRFHCWRHGGHGWLNMRQALEHSCDVFYYETARRVGIDRIAEMAKRLGIGVEPDLPLASLSEGLVPSREWKRRVKGTEWQVGDTLNAGIGQGFVLATPVQLAVMAARIASGSQVVPRLVRARAGQPVPLPPPPEMGISPAHFEIVRGGMHDVVNGTHGTARGSRIKDDDWLMAGKTGTSQVRNITAAERARGVFRNEDLPWDRRDHALFIAFAPWGRPRYALSVVVEHGGGGSHTAAPIARDILLAVRDFVAPQVELPSSRGFDAPVPDARPTGRA